MLGLRRRPDSGRLSGQLRTTWMPIGAAKTLGHKPSSFRTLSLDRPMAAWGITLPGSSGRRGRARGPSRRGPCAPRPRSSFGARVRAARDCVRARDNGFCARTLLAGRRRGYGRRGNGRGCERSPDESARAPRRRRHVGWCRSLPRRALLQARSGSLPSAIGVGSVEEQESYP
jgi:hypothetical protein